MSDKYAVITAHRAEYPITLMCRVLRTAGHRVGRKRVARLMRANGLQARRRRRCYGAVLLSRTMTGPPLALRPKRFCASFASR